MTSANVFSWTIVQLKNWLRENSPETPLSGGKLALVSKVSSLLSAKEIEKRLKAEVQVIPDTSPSWENLPPPGNPGWTNVVDSLPALSTSTLETYLQRFGGYVKNWTTGCQLFSHGHVTGLQYHSGADGVAFCKGKVKPRMKKGLYTCCAFLSCSSEANVENILGALCECKAGLAQSCMHVAGLLIMLSYLAETSSTSLPCKWLKPSASTSNSDAQVIFQRDLVIGGVKAVSPWTGPTLDPANLLDALTAADIETSWTAYQKIDQQNILRSSQVADVTSNYTDPITILRQYAKFKKIEDLTVDDLINCLSVNNDQRIFIERATRSQSESAMWYQVRSLRITASNFGLVCRDRRDNKVPPFVLSVIRNGADISHLPAIKYGRGHESQAIAAYIKARPDREVLRAGIFIHERLHFLGASPDAIVKKADDDEKGCLEVKCTFAHRNSTIAEACEEKNFFLEKTASGIFLKKNHNYYCQVIGQMGVTGLKWCDFVVYTKKDLHIETIVHDNRMWEAMTSTLTKYYKEVVGKSILESLVDE